MNPSREGWLRRDGVDLHYVEWEGDRAPILFLHGLSSNARFWDRVAGHLRNRRRVALDQRGHGLTGSAIDPAGFAMHELLADLAFVIAGLGLERPVVVGHSWGASVALEFVVKYPELASALVFVDGPVMGIARLLSWDEAQAMMQPPLPHFATLTAAIEDSQRAFKEAWGDDLQPFVEARVMADGDGLVLTMTSAARLELLRGLYGSDPEQLWPKVRVPAAVLAATVKERRISKWSENGVARLREMAPSVSIQQFDTPHDIPLYAPIGVAAEIERLAEIPVSTKWR